MLRNVFSRQSRLALSATPARAVFTWGVILSYTAAAWAFPTALPGWVWTAAGLLGFVGFAFLGRRWADKDLKLADGDKTE
jgi:hypothetical protein